MKEKPIIRIWDLGDNQYQLDYHTKKITREEAYKLLDKIVKIYKGDKR